LLFLYRHVLDVTCHGLRTYQSNSAKRLPVVLSTAEVRSVLAQLDGTCWLMRELLYGSGRLMQAHRLRVKDLVLERAELSCATLVRIGDGLAGSDQRTISNTLKVV